MKMFEEDLNELREKGLERKIQVPDGVINLSSNDYLGLSSHPDVKEASLNAVQKWGTGGTSSRLLAGTFPPHAELEKSLASFLKKEAALVFSSGYHVNTGIFPALATTQDIIFFDRLCHASLIDGIRLSGARFASFHHNDPSHLDTLLKKQRKNYRRTFIVTEGAFSMDGDLPPIKELAELKKKYDALLYIDEAHSFGLFGPDGRGVASQDGVLADIDIFVATLSKSMGSQGGFVAGSDVLIKLLTSKCRSFIYTTALAPAMAAAGLSALKLFPEMNDRRMKISTEAQLLREKLANLGWNTLKSASQIIPIWTGTVEDTQKLSAHLLSHGYFVPSIRPPTVSPGEGRLRLSVAYDQAVHGYSDFIHALQTEKDIPQHRRQEKVGKTH